MSVFSVKSASSMMLLFVGLSLACICLLASVSEAAPQRLLTKPEQFCRMPARKGVCRALIMRWSYDPERQQCEEFTFGGCDGNGNNFASYESCMSTCQGM